MDWAGQDWVKHLGNRQRENGDGWGESRWGGGLIGEIGHEAEMRRVKEEQRRGRRQNSGVGEMGHEAERTRGKGEAKTEIKDGMRVE